VTVHRLQQFIFCGARLQIQRDVKGVELEKIAMAAARRTGSTVTQPFPAVGAVAAPVR